MPITYPLSISYSTDILFARALGFHPSNAEFAQITDTIDPEKEGVVMWESFARICALKMKCTTISRVISICCKA